MTTFNGEATTTAPETEAKVETRETATTQPATTTTPVTWTKPESRLKATPGLWDEACVVGEMLEYCRPHRSKTERRFINKFIKPHGVTMDSFGNLFKRIGAAPVLWSCHTDTVHNAKGMQKIVYRADHNGDTILETAADQRTGCLGADDTCGLWLMLQMIQHNVEGLYIFHRGEEEGRLGSSWIARQTPEKLKDIKFAIAFDRKGTKSIITHQMGRRCCSDEFTKSLADGLGLGHQGDDGGSYTDTASYTDLIGECTNVSVGYERAHTDMENTNLDYLFKLRDALLKLDLSKLEAKRKPGEEEPRVPRTYGGGYGRDIWDDIYYQEPSYVSDYVWDKAAKMYVPAVNTPATVPAARSGTSWQEREKARHTRPRHDLGVTKMSPQARAHSTTRPGTPDDKRWGECSQCGMNFDEALAFRKQRAQEARKTVLTHDRVDRAVGRVFAQQLANRPAANTHYEMVRMIKDNPEVVADLLEGQGYGPLEIRDHILRSYGVPGTDRH